MKQKNSIATVGSRIQEKIFVSCLGSRLFCAAYDRCHQPVVMSHLSINTGNSRIISYKTGEKNY